MALRPRVRVAASRFEGVDLMLENVKAYYGKVLQDQSDLMTDACCSDPRL